MSQENNKKKYLILHYILASEPECIFDNMNTVKPKTNHYSLIKTYFSIEK